MMLTNRSRARLALAGLLAVGPLALSAQTTTATVKNAIDQYDQLNFERAIALLEPIFKPGYLLAVDDTDRVRALKYLGASHAVLDPTDSLAVNYFVAALDFNPFTDLETDKFTPNVQVIFAKAKQQIFHAAVKGIDPKVIDPRSQRSDSNSVTFHVITTHKANLIVTLLRQGKDSLQQRRELYNGVSDGLRDLPWPGVWANGQLVDSGTYELRVDATSQTTDDKTSKESKSQVFLVQEAFEPLETPLQPLEPGKDLLPPQYASNSKWTDLAKGLFLTASAAAITVPLKRTDLAGSPATLVAGAALGAGLGSAIITFWYRSRNTDIQTNILENQRRMAQWSAFNQGVKDRNDRRIAQRFLVIVPPNFGR